MYDFIERLPPWLHYKTAIVMDEEWARYVCDLEDADEELPPTGDGPEEGFAPLYYDPGVARLDLIADRVMSVRSAIFGVNNKDGKEPRFDPIERPTTALQRERERRTIRILEETDALFTSGGLTLMGWAED